MMRHTAGDHRLTSHPVSSLSPARRGARRVTWVWALAASVLAVLPSVVIQPHVAEASRPAAGGATATPSRPAPALDTNTVSRLGGASHAAAAAKPQVGVVFDANVGQADPAVRFVGHGPGYSLLITPTEAIMRLGGGTKPDAHGRPNHPTDQPQATLMFTQVGADGAAAVSAEHQLAGRTNYFLGNDSSRWARNVSTYSSVAVGDEYPGITLNYDGGGRGLEDIYVVAPGASPAAIQTQIDGATGVTLTPSGDLHIGTSVGPITEPRPQAYQDTPSGRHSVTANFVLTKPNVVGFVVGSYDTSLPVTIDPPLSYSSYLGGSADDVLAGVAVNGSGDVVVSGNTSSTNFPISNALQSFNAGSQDITVSEFDPTGASLLFSTYIGGSGGEYPIGMALDGSGNIYLTGATSSSNFPLQSPYQSTFYGGGAVFVVKINSSGSQLLYSTYISGTATSQNPAGTGIAVDSSGDMYVVGYTNDYSFPVTSGAFETSPSNGYCCKGFGDPAAFALKLNPTGSSLTYSTFLAGAGYDTASSVAINSSGQAYVAGGTTSFNFPLKNSLIADTTAITKSFLTVLSTDGSSEVFSTFLTALGSGCGGGLVALDGNGAPYVASSCNVAGGLPCTGSGSFQSALAGGSDGTLQKLAPDGSAFTYCTYLGGTGDDGIGALVVDSGGDAYVAGTTGSTDFPTASPAQATNGGSGDAFVAEMNPTGSALLFSTYLGGSGAEYPFAEGLAVDSGGNIDVAGATASTNFPVTGTAYQGISGGSYDGFVVRYGNAVSLPGGPLTGLEAPGLPNPAEPGCNCSRAQGGDPVDTATGYFAESFTDLSIPGRSYPLAMGRSYSTAFAGNDGPLGYGWRPGDSMNLAVNGTTVTVTQETGATVTFTQNGSNYTAAPRVIATLVHNGDGTWTFVRLGRDTFTFDSSGNLTRIVDPNGYATTFSYTSGKLSTVTDPAGRTLTFAWTGTHITTVTDANVSPSRVVTYQYNDGLGNLTDVLDVNAGHAQFSYDANHRMTVMKDPKCFATTGCPGVQNNYGTDGRVAWQKDQLNRQTTFSYSGTAAAALTAPSATTTVTDPKGNVTQDQYGYGVLMARTLGYGTASAATTQHDYDANTLMPTWTQDPNGHISTATVDSHANVLTQTDALSRTTTLTYNAFNQVLTSQDPLGVTTTNTYDSHANLLSTSTPVSGSSCPCQVTTYRYQDPGHIGDLTSKVDPDGNVWNYVYDTYGDHTQTIDPLGDRTEYTYDHDGRTTNSITPKGARSVVQKAAGGGIATNNGWSMILRADGTDWAWGYNADGETGSGTTATPVTTPKEVCAVGQTSPCSQFLSSLSDTAAGGLQGIAAKSDGTVYDWGNNSVGQLGTGNTTNSTVPVQVTGLGGVTVTNVVSGYENSIALTSGGNLYAWGLNSSGELGDGTTSGHYSPVKVCAAGATAPCSSFLSGVTQIAAHRRYTMALTSAGNVYSWGANDHGQLGNGGSTNQSTPQEVCAPGQTAPCSQFLSNITQIAAGTDFAMALKSDGTVYVWGANDHGDLSNGTTDSSSHPIPGQVSGLSGVTSIAAGKSHALVILNDGSLRSWGLNGNGELGVGAKDTTGCQCRSTVQTVLNVFQATAIAAGDISSIALTVDGSAWSWGGNAHGELGNGSSGTDKTSPVKFGTITTSVNAAYETNYTFNAFGQVLNTTDPLGHVTKNIYDADGNVSTFTDGNNNLTTYVYDVANELTQTKRADSPQTTVTTDYNADGTILDEKDGKNNPIQTFGYDSLGRKTTATDALGNVTTITHDGAGNQLTTQDPGGNCSGTPKTGCTTSTYDVANQLKTVTYSDGVTPNVTNIAYDADGQRIGMTDGTGTSAWVLDNLHRTTSYTNGNGSQVQYAYNLRNLITTLTYPGSHNVTRGYDAAGRWTSVLDWNGKTTTVAYDQNSNLATETMPTSGTSVVDTIGYNAADQTTSMSSMQGATTIFSATYTRDSNAQLASDTSAATNQTTFKYTALNQTCYAGSSTSNACSSPPANSQAFAFDAADNLTKLGGATQQFNTADQLCWTLSGTSANNCATVPSGATTYSYDTRGDRTSKVTSANAGTCNTFDQARRITAIASGTGASCTSPTTLGTYAYDGDGLRMSKGTTHYTWDESGGLRLLLVDGSTDYIYGPGGLPLEQINGATTYWYHHDQIGSTRAITDSAGTKQASYTFDPYGNLTSSTGSLTNPFRFAGQYLDTESGLYYVRARYYDPSTAQFMSRDPLVAMTRSPYAYVAGNPLNATDPSGEWGIPCLPISLGACHRVPDFTSYSYGVGPAWLGLQVTVTTDRFQHTYTGIGFAAGKNWTIVSAQYTQGWIGGVDAAPESESCVSSFVSSFTFQGGANPGLGWGKVFSPGASGQKWATIYTAGTPSIGGSVDYTSQPDQNPPPFDYDGWRQLVGPGHHL